MDLRNEWNKEDVDVLFNEVMQDYSLKNEYYEQEALLAEDDSEWGVGGQNADFSTESFNDLLFLLNSWSANSDKKNINAQVQIEMIKDELKDRAKKNKWLMFRLPLNLL